IPASGAVGNCNRCRIALLKSRHAGSSRKAGPHIVELLLLDERKDGVKPRAGLFFSRATVGITSPMARPSGPRELLVGALVIDHPQCEVLEVVGALSAAGRFARGLDGG